MQTQPSYQHHLGMKKLHTCEAGARQKSVKGKCQNEVWFVCVSAYVFSSVGEQLGVDIKTKSHCSLRLCLLHNKPLALTRHIGFFPLACSLEPYRAREKAPCWTRFLCGSISRLLFCPSWPYNAFSPQTREKCKTSVDYIKIWHFQAHTLSNLNHSSHFNLPLYTVYIYIFLLPFSNFFEYLGWQWSYSFFFIPALSVWDIMKSNSPGGQELSAISDTFLSHSPLMVVWNFQL